MTRRERQILALLKQGLANKQIAGQLGVVEDTVKKHLQHVYDKLGVHRRTLVLVGETGDDPPRHLTACAGSLAAGSSTFGEWHSPAGADNVDL